MSNRLTTIHYEIGESEVLRSMGEDDEDSLVRFGKGRMHYARQFGDLYKYNFVLKKLKERKVTKLLYAGCGQDAVRKIMDQQCITCPHYVGLDLHRRWLQDAVGVENSIAAHYVQYDLSKGLGIFEDGEFDVVLALDVVEHMPTKQLGWQLINELNRVCSNLLIISTPQQQGDSPYFPMHKYEFTFDEHRSIMGILTEHYEDSSRHGLHMSVPQFATLLAEDEELRAQTEFLTPNIMRGIAASTRPDIANDILMCFDNRYNLHEAS